MAIVAYDETILPTTKYLPPARPPEEDGGWFSSFGASFLRENDIWAMTRMATREEFAPNPDFEFDTVARLSPGFASNPEPFYGARSYAEFAQIEARVAEEAKMLQQAQSSGLGGFLGGLSGAILSPTTFIPGGAIYRGAKMASILKSTAAVGVAAAGATIAQETILQADQLARTDEESALNVAFALALGGMLGGAVSAMTRKEISTLARDMADDPGNVAIHIPGVTPVLGDGTLSAARNPEADSMGLGNVEGIAPSLPGFDKLAGLNPVSRGLSNEFSPTVRGMTASLDTGGLKVEGQANIGGDVASKAKQWYSLSFNALRKRAELMGGNFASRLMGVRQFAEETTFALRRGGEHSDPAVKEYANYLRTEVYGKVLSEARRVGMKGFDKLDDEYIEKYVNRMVRKGLVTKDHDEFTAIIEEHFTETLTDMWAKNLDKMEDLNVRDLEAADDLTLDKEGVQALRTQLEAQIANLPQQFADEVRFLAEEIRALRAEAKATDKIEAKLLRDEAKMLEEQNKEMLAEFNKAENKLKGRFSRIGRTASGLQRSQQIALAQIMALREAADATRGRLARKVQKIMDNMDKWSDKRLDEEISKLEDQIERTFRVWMKGDEKLSKMKEVPDDFRELEFSDVRSTEKISIEEARQAQRQEKLDTLLEALDDAKGLDRDSKRLAVERVAKAAIEEGENINFKRAQQEKKLNERIAAADPRKAAEEAANLRNRAAQRQGKVFDRMADAGVAGTSRADLQVGKAAKDLANYVAMQYMGNSNHMPFLSILQERGPELARMLNIDETRVWGNGRRFEEFLENDSEYLMRSYLRTMGADIELQRKFGRVNPLAQDSPYLRQMIDEFDEQRAAARVEADGKIAKGGDKAKIEKKLDKKLQAIAKAQDRSIKDLHGLVDRIRHTRGVPLDPEGIGYRMGKTALNMNVVTLMGNMMLTSVADMAAIVMKHGFSGIFRDGLLPLVTNMKATRMQMREAQDAGVALDMVLHGRMAALFDVMDEVRGGTMFERGLQFATNHMGAMTLMDRWNSGIKQLEGAITVTKISRNLETLATAAPGSRAAQKAERYLSGLGLDPRTASVLWKEFQTSGSVVDGITLPNTEQWGKVAESQIEAAEAKLVAAREDLNTITKQERELSRKLRTAKNAENRAAPGAQPETRQKLAEAVQKAEDELAPVRDALQKQQDKVTKLYIDAQGKSATYNQADDLRRAFRGAIARAVDDTIVTPGGERPLWMDGSMMGRLIGQFRSFTFSSTQKILWAGAQDLRSGELAPLGGLVFSVALGMLSYYTKQIARGEEAAAKVQDASWEKLLLEGIKSSLVLGVLAEGQSFMEEIPGAVSGIATLGTGATKRNPFAGPVTAALGPSLGLIGNLDNVISGTLSGDVKDGDIRSLRRLIPYNNVFWLSRAFNSVEEGLKQ